MWLARRETNVSSIMERICWQIKHFHRNELGPTKRAVEANKKRLPRLAGWNRWRDPTEGSEKESLRLLLQSFYRLAGFR
jgi:hypothetical protein